MLKQPSLLKGEFILVTSNFFQVQREMKFTHLCILALKSYKNLLCITLKLCLIKQDRYITFFDVLYSPFKERRWKHLNIFMTGTAVCLKYIVLRALS